MTKDEALDLALEALEWDADYDTSVTLQKAAITAIKQARSAPVQEPVAVYGYCPICGAEGVMRERRLNGYDKCAKGHTYPSSKATPPAQPAPVQNIGVEQDERVFARIEARKNRDAVATRPATREEKIVNPGVYEVPVQDRVWPEKFQDRLRDEWYSFDPEVEMSDFSKSVYWLENSPNTRDKLASKELRRLHEDNIRLKKCLFQMQEAAKQLAAQPAPVKVWEAEGYDALMQEMQMVKARNIRQHAEIERLSALVRAQQITIDKLEASFVQQETEDLYELAVKADNGGQP